MFVPKAKDGELVRVLRSGRRLWVESGEVKHKGGKNGDEWYPLIDSGRKCKEQRQNGWHEVGPKVAPMEVDENKPTPESVNRVPSFANNGKTMFRNVYSRKRKRSNPKGSLLSDDFGGGKEKGDRKFGLHFVRRQRRKVQSFEQQIDGSNGLLSVVVEPSCAGCYLFSSLLGCLLTHMTRKDIGLVELSAFLLSTPISPVFASFGIQFLRGLPCSMSRGYCRIFGAKKLIPMFTVNFSAAPLCFLHLHATMYFRSARLSSLCRIDFHSRTEIATDISEPRPVINVQSDQSLSKVVGSKKDDPKFMKNVNPSLGIGKLGSRNVHYRNGVTTRSGSKRRRRSLSTRRARNPSPFVLQKPSGPLGFHHLARRKNPSSLPLGPNQVLRRSARKNSSDNISVPKPTSSTLSLNVDIDSQSCSANILVVETEKCYRVEGAEIMLDFSDSNEWVLAVKKDGLERYCLKIQREMRPCTTNRFTHAVIWAGENGWKLEFPERNDWLVFKELYKVCGERNIVPTSPAVKIIPVPGVCEVINACDSTIAAFKRPDSYIRMASDELSRALSSRAANYDMDSEDEEWLGKLNSELDEADNVSEETFELMIDAFEKASYSFLEDCNDEKAAANVCMDLASSAVAESVFRYWMKKRKQKCGPLMRVFQYNQPKRAELITKPVLRKKRSLKRPTIQPIQRGRGKDSTVLQAIAAERGAVEDKNAVLRVEEAKASVSRSMEEAIIKRKRAQLLMENAELAMYRATMALRIADAAQFADSQQAAAHFLD